MNHTIWPGSFPVYPDLLKDAGYYIGYTGKGWGPGNWQVSERKYSPAGPAYNEARLDPPGEYLNDIDYAKNFEQFLAAKPKDGPFAFWAGFSEPHRPYDAGIGAERGKGAEEIRVPGFFPEAPEVRRDIADYAFEIEWFDQHLGKILDTLDSHGELENTLIVVTSDNGMPFPRAKATLYDYGVRAPLAIRWGAKVEPGRAIDDFVSFPDFAPTFLEAAGLPATPGMTGRSLMPLLLSTESGQVDPERNQAVFGIERHFPGSRPEGRGYPMRGIRTRDYLYIQNLTPDADPVGNHPGPAWPEDDPVGGFGDIDGSPTKTHMWRHRKEHPELFRLAFGQRPAEELYMIRDDPYNMKNLAADPELAEIKQDLAERLKQHLERTNDPRAVGRGDQLDEIMKRYPVLGSNK